MICWKSPEDYITFYSLDNVEKFCVKYVDTIAIPVLPDEKETILCLLFSFRVRFNEL